MTADNPLRGSPTRIFLDFLIQKNPSGGTSLFADDPTIRQTVLGYMVPVAVVERSDINYHIDRTLYNENVRSNTYEATVLLIHSHIR